MTIMTKILVGGAGLAALAAAAPSVAQYSNGYNNNGYNNNTYNGYNQGYNNSYNGRYANAYGNNNVTAMATQQCSAAVQNRLVQRTNSRGISGIVGQLFGVNSYSGRVTQITQVVPRSNMIRVRGLASSGRNTGYGQYGVGAYGAAGYAYQPDLSFRCDVDFRGNVRNVNITRR